MQLFQKKNFFDPTNPLQTYHYVKVPNPSLHCVTLIPNTEVPAVWFVLLIMKTEDLLCSQEQDETLSQVS